MPRFSFRRAKNLNNSRTPKRQSPKPSAAELIQKRTFSERIASNKFAQRAALFASAASLSAALSCSPRIVKIENLSASRRAESRRAGIEEIKVHYSNGTAETYFFDMDLIKSTVMLAVSSQISKEKMTSEMALLLRAVEKQKTNSLPNANRGKSMRWFSQSTGEEILKILSKKQRAELIKAKGDFSAIKESLSVQQLLEIEMAAIKAGA